MSCDASYVRLAGVSVSHLYNLRQRAGYLKFRTQWTRTRPQTNPKFFNPCGNVATARVNDPCPACSGN